MCWVFIQSKFGVECSIKLCQEGFRLHIKKMLFTRGVWALEQSPQGSGHSSKPKRVQETFGQYCQTHGVTSGVSCAALKLLQNFLVFMVSVWISSSFVVMVHHYYAEVFFSGFHYQQQYEIVVLGKARGNFTHSDILQSSNRLA